MDSVSMDERMNCSWHLRNILAILASLVSV